MLPPSLACAACGAALPESSWQCPQCGTSTTKVSESTSVPTTAGVGGATVHVEFRGTPRFRLDRRLGAGGMGVVFAAFDHQRGEAVALKTLYNRSPVAVSRLKREFRALAEVTHPNLVGLYELVAEHGDWFYTMELIDGVDFLRAVRRRELDVTRLRHLLGQVADGVRAIHGAGKLHRDLKPSNVLVTPGSRAVLLDFGIVTELETEGPQMAPEQGFVGTLAYTAPEQLQGRTDEASDWYALGVMLYQTLTGRLPYRGDPYRIMTDKRSVDPERPDAIVPGLPADLVQLCIELMARDPAARPDAGDVLQRLGHQPRRAWASGASVVRDRAAIGRDAQIAALTEAFKSIGPATAVVAAVHGSSGSGKSALVQWFLRARIPPNAVLLQGRCFVRESVPYKALDGIIEQLSWYLHALAPRLLQPLVPSDIGAAARVFPVLDWLKDEVRETGAAAEELDPIQVRRHAFGALRELLRRIAATHPLVIVIEDLQWSDAESTVALEELLLQPGRPGALVVASFRTDDIATHPFLQALIERGRRDDAQLRVREIELGRLTDEATRGLAATLVADASPDPVELDRIVREARGVPFLVELLSRYAATADGTADGPETVDEVIAAELRELPDGCRAFLEVVTVAGRPIDSMVVRTAADVDGDERRLVGALQSAHLLRPSGSATMVEPYHDRIRESVLTRLAASRLSAIHLRLAQAMESRGVDEPETLSEHFLEGGQRARAAVYAGRAASQAARKLAFERAGSLYQRALTLAPESADRAGWQIGLAEALANAGRGVDAADAYLAAASLPGVDAAEMRRAAADHLLRCGRVRQGLEVIDALAESVGLGIRRSRTRTIARVVGRRAWLRLRGLAFTERPAEQCDAAALARIDMCITLAAGLARVDGIRAADYQSLATLQALRTGEPRRVAHALLGEAAFRGLGGSRSRADTERLLVRATAVAARLDQPHLNGVARLVTGMTHCHAGRFHLARPEAEAAERIFRQQCVGVWRDIDLAHAYAMLTTYYLGELADLAQRVPRRLQEAKDHDDSYAAGDAMGRPNILWLARDDVAGARQALAEIRQPDSAHQVDWPDWLRLFAETQVDLYGGEGAAAWTRMAAAWPRLARTTVMWVQSTRIEAAHLRGRAALAAAAQVGGGSAAVEPLRAVRHTVLRLRRERVAWASGFADLLAAGAADQAGGADARTTLARALETLEEARLGLFAAAARRRLAAMVGGSEGTALVEAADRWMAAQGIADAARMTAMLAPGFRA